jgi:hypothetical protein
MRLMPILPPLLVIAGLAACACPPKPTIHVEPGGTSGSAAPVAAPPTCAGQAARVEALYRAELERQDPKHAAALAADNGAMVKAACVRGEATIGPCVAAAATVAAVEACLPPLDDEGSEGQALPPAAPGAATATPAPVSTP